MLTIKSFHHYFVYILQALERVNADKECSVENCRYEIVRENRYEAALRHLDEHNFRDEVLSVNFGVTIEIPEMKMLCQKLLEANMSLALISLKSDTIVGMRVMRISTIEDKFKVEDFQSPAAKSMIQFLDYAKERLDVFKYYNVNEAVDLFGLSVDRDYRRQGIGLKLLKAALLFLTSMNLGPTLVKGGCSSNYSKRIYEKLDFEELFEIMYEDYKPDGKVVITKTGENKSMKSYAKMV